MPEPKNSPAPPSGPTDPFVGRQVRDFRIVARIGRGGMGAVYKAEHALLRETRALKVIRAERFHSVPHAAERFQREARIAVRLRHPNLVLIYDFFIEGGDHFLVMEYVVGESLAQRIRAEGVLTAEEACRIGIQCCAGLAHAHDMGIVHRDLSPENVLLQPGPDGLQAKIIDFGIARAAVADAEDTAAKMEATLTRVGDFLGKPRYASPEQAGKLRAGETIDRRSDLYTLGLILYEMVTGDLPFRSDTEIGYLSLHAFQTPARPTEIRPDLRIPPALERVILRCLEKDRDARFADARELAAALEWARGPGDPRDAPFPLDAPARDPSEATRYVRVARAPEADWRAERDAEPGVADEDRGALLRALAVVAGLTLLGVGVGTAAWWWTQPSASIEAPSAAPSEDARDAPSGAAEPAPPPSGARPPAEAEPIFPVASRDVAPDPAPPRDAGLEPAGAAEAAPAQAASPGPTPTREASPRPAAPEPAPAVARVPPPAPERPPRRPEPQPAPAVARPPAPTVPAFADEAEMQAAFDAAVAFEGKHDARAAVENWDRFLKRRPTGALEQQAKRRRTALWLDMH